MPPRFRIPYVDIKGAQRLSRVQVVQVNRPSGRLSQAVFTAARVMLFQDVAGKPPVLRKSLT
jgi:hypothetical protein